MYDVPPVTVSVPLFWSVSVPEALALLAPKSTVGTLTPAGPTPPPMFRRPTDVPFCPIRSSPGVRS